MKGNYRRAEHVLRSAVEKRPDQPKSWDNLGLVLYRTNRYPEAREAFGKEVALAPQSSDGHYNLGFALAADNKVDEAIELKNGVPVPVGVLPKGGGGKKAARSRS